MVKYADIIVGYSTYPHIDMYETGSKVFDLIIDKIRKKISTILCIKSTFQFSLKRSRWIHPLEQ